MNKLFCDVLIFGAGIIGASLALSLSQSGIKVIIIDNKKLILTTNNIVPNIRVSAINHASVEFFKKINIWKYIPDKFCSSYCYLKVWEWSSAEVTFHSKSINLSKMGYIIENNRLKLALWKGIEDAITATLYCPFTLVSLEYKNTFWECILNNHTIINAHLLIGADGVNSQIREKLGIGITGYQYDQCCMLLIIKTECFKDGTIWQFFTPQGPIGFLPLYDHWGSLMWFNTSENIHKLQQLPKSVLEKKIKDNFYKQLGEIKLHDKLVVPLISQYAHRYIFLRGALVGDSAHVIHPLAGQGINLGIRDVISLSNLLISSNILNHNNNLDNILTSYQNNRQKDIHLMQSSINFLYFIFHNNFLPLKITRNLAFMIIEKLPYIKKKVLKYAVGL